MRDAVICASGLRGDEVCERGVTDPGAAIIVLQLTGQSFRSMMTTPVPETYEVNIISALSKRNGSKCSQGGSETVAGEDQLVAGMFVDGRRDFGCQSAGD